MTCLLYGRSRAPRLAGATRPASLTPTVIAFEENKPAVPDLSSTP